MAVFGGEKMCSFFQLVSIQNNITRYKVHGDHVYNKI